MERREPEVRRDAMGTCQVWSCGDVAQTASLLARQAQRVEQEKEIKRLQEPPTSSEVTRAAVRRIPLRPWAAARNNATCLLIILASRSNLRSGTASLRRPGCRRPSHDLSLRHQDSADGRFFPLAHLRLTNKQTRYLAIRRGVMRMSTAEAALHLAPYDGPIEDRCKVVGTTIDML